ncbi:DUF5949 family protein, partial [Streptomyces californicus]
MTTPQAPVGTFTQAQLGTQILIGWSGRQPGADQDTAFLLAYSLGDGQDGPEAGREALHTALGRAGLRVGGPIASPRPSAPDARPPCRPSREGLRDGRRRRTAE